MVAHRIISVLLLWAANALTLQAQNYSVHDTVTEYPNKGTFYHDKFEGRKCASGDIFDQNKFTAAHWCIKMGTMVMVTNRNSGKQVIVKINDRCPKHGVLDMTHRAAHAIGIRGMQPVTIRILPDGYEDQWAAQDAIFDSVQSRLSPNVKNSPPPAGSTQRSSKRAKPTPHKTATNGNAYSLQLGTAASHGEVYSMLRRLPAEYRDMAQIESLEGTDSLRLSLDLKADRKHATAIATALRSKFSDIKIVPSN